MAGLAYCRSTGPVDRSSSRSTGAVDRRAQACSPALGWWPIDRDGWPSRELCFLEIAQVDWVGRPAESSTLCNQSQSTGVIDLRDQWSKMWQLASRPPGRPEGQIGPFQLPTGRFEMGLYIPPFELVFNKSNFSHLYKCLTASFQKSFWV